MENEPLSLDVRQDIGYDLPTDENIIREMQRVLGTGIESSLDVTIPSTDERYQKAIEIVHINPHAVSKKELRKRLWQLSKMGYDVESGYRMGHQQLETYFGGVRRGIEQKVFTPLKAS